MNYRQARRLSEGEFSPRYSRPCLSLNPLENHPNERIKKDCVLPFVFREDTAHQKVSDDEEKSPNERLKERKSEHPEENNAKSGAFSHSREFKGIQLGKPIECHDPVRVEKCESAPVCSEKRMAHCAVALCFDEEHRNGGKPCDYPKLRKSKRKCKQRAAHCIYKVFKSRTTQLYNTSVLIISYRKEREILFCSCPP